MLELTILKICMFPEMVSPNRISRQLRSTFWDLFMRLTWRFIISAPMNRIPEGRLSLPLRLLDYMDVLPNLNTELRNLDVSAWLEVWARMPAYKEKTSPSTPY